MDWAAGIMAVLTLVSVVVAAVARGDARRAAAAAAGAVLEAKDANKISKDANALASTANQIAKDAAHDAQAAPTEVAWDEVIVALASLQAFDPTGEPVGDLLRSLSARAMILIDRIPGNSLGNWMAAEQAAGTHLMREAFERAQEFRRRQGRDLSVDETMEYDEAFHLWVAAYTRNLRRFRRVGIDQDVIDTLTDRAWKTGDAVAKRNGWPTPPRAIPGLEPLPARSDSSP